MEAIEQEAGRVRSELGSTPETDDAPKPEWIREMCPECGAPVVSNLYYIGGKGHTILWECWESLGEQPTCTYRKVLQ